MGHKAMIRRSRRFSFRDLVAATVSAIRFSDFAGPTLGGKRPKNCRASYRRSIHNLGGIIGPPECRPSPLRAGLRNQYALTPTYDEKQKLFGLTPKP
jgi:hypothetical protein